MKKTITLLLLGILHTSVRAQVTMNLDAELLKTSTSAGGTAMPTTGLAILVASTLDNTFGIPSPSAYATGDDIVVQAFDLSGGVNTAGTLTHSVITTPSGAWNAGDFIQLYWFPTLTLADYNGSVLPGNNTPFGQYRDPATVTPLQTSTGGNLWVTPGPGGQLNFQFFTDDASLLVSAGTGLSPASDGLADLTTVPEPSAYTVIFGGLCVVAGAARRKFLKRQA